MESKVGDLLEATTPKKEKGKDKDKDKARGGVGRETACMGWDKHGIAGACACMGWVRHCGERGARWHAAATTASSLFVRSSLTTSSCCPIAEEGPQGSFQ